MSHKKEEEQDNIIYLRRMLFLIDRDEKKVRFFFGVSSINKIKKNYCSII
jgi:hypothetical protein